MISHLPALRLSCAAIAAAGVLLTVSIGSAVAQSYANMTEELTVTGAHVQERTVGRSEIGAPIDELSLSRTVDFSDLNLSRPGDAQMLDQRIQQAASTACSQLDQAFPESLYPSYQSDAADCVVQAIDEGREQARQVIAQLGAAPTFSR